MCAGRQVEAKYPALLFKQQLDAFVQKIFPMLRDNVKKEVTPHLAACIHAPRAVSHRSRRGSASGGDTPLASSEFFQPPPSFIICVWGLCSIRVGRGES